MKNRLLIGLMMFALIMIVASCADVEPDAAKCLTGHTYGFWGGLWHGMIAPFAFIGSLFSDDIAVWAANNNGGWYSFGFVLGVGGFSFGASSRK